MDILVIPCIAVSHLAIFNHIFLAECMQIISLGCGFSCNNRMVYYSSGPIPVLCRHTSDLWPCINTKFPYRNPCIFWACLFFISMSIKEAHKPHRLTVVWVLTYTWEPVSAVIGTFRVYTNHDGNLVLFSVTGDVITQTNWAPMS